MILKKYQGVRHLKNIKGSDTLIMFFEDTVRRLCRRDELEEKGQKLDTLITELTNKGVFNGVKAKRARAAAHIRNKASHAQWDEFGIDDIKATIEFKREVISQILHR